MPKQYPRELRERAVRLVAEHRSDYESELRVHRSPDRRLHRHHRRCPRHALVEYTIGLYKTELIKKAGPWKTLADVELATAKYVDW
jgi:hypothetical protein